jgi:hypothetical protein
MYPDKDRTIPISPQQGKKRVVACQCAFVCQFGFVRNEKEIKTLIDLGIMYNRITEIPAGVIAVLF